MTSTNLSKALSQILQDISENKMSTFFNAGIADRIEKAFMDAGMDRSVIDPILKSIEFAGIPLPEPKPYNEMAPLQDMAKAFYRDINKILKDYL